MTLRQKISAIWRHLTTPQFKTPAKVTPVPVDATFPESFIQVPSSNYRKDGNEHLYLVLHHSDGWSKTGNPEVGDIAWCLNPEAQVSYHCIIAWNGDRTVLVKDDDQAYHAGVSAWAGRTNCNKFTLGLAFGGDTQTGEMRPNGSKLLTPTEIQSALEYILPRAKKYGWKAENIITHQMIAPKRKTDVSEAVLKQVREAFEKAGK